MKPEFVKIDDKKYKINTDFRTALECNSIAEDNSIGEHEKALAVIYKLFGDDGLNDRHNHDRLLELALKYLLRGEEKQQSNNEEPNMDFIQDESFINASFRSDYKIDLDKEEMHWWSFCDLLNGLTEDCVLNRVRYIRDYDIGEIKDHKERQKWLKSKESVALKKKTPTLTEEQQNIINKYKKQANQK